MSLINLAKIFRTFISIIELEYLLSWDYTIKMTKNEKNWHVSVEFLENTEIID